MDGDRPTYPSNRGHPPWLARRRAARARLGRAAARGKPAALRRARPPTATRGRPMTERQTERRDVLLLVSIDTEEDNMALTRVGVSVENVRELPRLAGFLMGLGVRAT